MEDSLKKRYTFKLISTGTIGVSNVGIHALASRGLGPSGYGDYSFIFNFFTQLMGFLELGSSPALFTKISQRPTDSGVFCFYFGFSLCVLLAQMALIYLTGALGHASTLWPGLTLQTVALGALTSFLTWFTQILSGVNDACGLTASSELRKSTNKILSFAAIAVFVIWGKLTLSLFLVLCNVLLIFLVLRLVLTLRHSGMWANLGHPFRNRSIQNYFHEFYVFSHPLFIYSLVTASTTLLDRWFLQRGAGSVEQGYFGLAVQISGISLLFSMGMVPLIHREFSIVESEHHLAKIFEKYIPLFTSASAFLCIFLSIYSRSVVNLFGGSRFAGAIPTVALFALFAIPQTFGQLSATLFYATSQTRVYRNIGIVSALLGIPLSYFLVMPRSEGGFELGALGLAIKMVAVQFLLMFIQLYIAAKLVKIAFWWHAFQQVSSYCAFLVLAMFTHVIFLRLPGFLHLMVGSLIYSLLVMFLVFLVPNLFGIERDLLRRIAQMVWTRVGAAGARL